MRRVRILLAAGAVLALAAITYAALAAQATGRPGTAATTVPAAAQTTADPATAAPSSTPAGPRAYGDGIYDVGTEIPPGTYTATAGDRPCYWARLRSYGRPDSIIDEDNLDPGETQLVGVLATDRGFKAANGCTWRPAAK
ncbi:hypothetical protein [Micromonospora carbonacea]|uniref:hypothetical protein n=1 Tax=Micromonospora carbonacea TaxID=47853 RepID=UPI0037140231